VSLTIPGISPDLFSVSVRPISSAKLWRETKSLDKIKVPEQLTFLKRMAPYMWLPKAAGDETRLHSPIGTFFNCPLTDAEKRLKALEVKGMFILCADMFAQLRESTIMRILRSVLN